MFQSGKFLGLRSLPIKLKEFEKTFEPSMDPKKVPTIKLNNGLQIPIIGLGTFAAMADGTLYKTVKNALNNGYRHFDCALVYENQEEIGRALNDCIKEGKVKREELFITSKVWLTYFKKDRTIKCVKKILDQFKMTYINLCLIHWPMSYAQVDNELHPKGPDGKLIDGKVDFTECWQGLEDCLKQGLVKSIGVSNFNKAQIDKLLSKSKTVPVVNQVESHPYLCQKKLKEFCEKKGIYLTAYSPLGNPGTTGSIINQDKDKDCLLKDPLVEKLAKKYKKNVGQILIKFQTERNVIVVPKSVTESRIKANISLFDFKLTADEIKQLEALDRNYRSYPFVETSHLTNYPFAPGIEF